MLWRRGKAKVILRLVKLYFFNINTREFFYGPNKHFEVPINNFEHLWKKFYRSEYSRNICYLDSRATYLASRMSIILKIFLRSNKCRQVPISYFFVFYFKKYILDITAAPWQIVNIDKNNSTIWCYLKSWTQSENARVSKSINVFLNYIFLK